MSTDDKFLNACGISDPAPMCPTCKFNHIAQQETRELVRQAAIAGWQVQRENRKLRETIKTLWCFGIAPLAALLILSMKGVL